MIHKKAGFSIAQALVAAAIIGILAVAGGDLISNLQKGQKAVEISVEFDTLKLSIQHVLNKKALCDIAFYNTDDTAVASFNPNAAVPANSAFGTLRMGTSKVAQTGASLGSGLRVESLTLQKVSGTTPTTIAGKTEVEVELLVTVEKVAPGVGPQKKNNSLNPFRFGLLVEAAAPHRILGCTVSGGGVGGGGGTIISGTRGTHTSVVINQATAQSFTTSATAQNFSVPDPEWKKITINGVSTNSGTPTPVSLVVVKSGSGEITVSGVTESGSMQSITSSASVPNPCIGGPTLGVYACLHRQADGTVQVKTSNMAYTYDVTK